jgi:hypothetical protein
MQCMADKSVDTSSDGNAKSEGKGESRAEIADNEDKPVGTGRGCCSVRSRAREAEGSTRRRRELGGAVEKSKSIGALPSNRDARVAAGETSSSKSMRCECILRFFLVAI